MTSFQDWLHSIAGKLSQTPSGPPGLVAVVPDDFLPDEFTRGAFAIFVAAGGAGFRSEIELENTSQTDSHGYEIFNMSVLVQGATNVQIGEVGPAQAITGYTAQTILNLDFVTKNGVSRDRAPQLTVQTKNTAAAVTLQQCGFATIATPTTNIWVPIPGRIVLRAIKGGGGRMMVRPTVDVMAIGFMAEWRKLEKRSL